MIREVMKICGLDCDETCAALAEVAGQGVDFDVEENCLDVKITMTSELNKKSFDAVKSRVYNIFSEQVYCAEDKELHALAAQLLAINGRTLAVAESLTGGEICSRLTRVPGISANFYEGVVCYNRGSKMNRLHIPKALLGAYGAVSRETAYAMVKGLVEPPVNIGLATTGLAGPQGDEGKPVGLVYIGVGAGEFITVFEKHLSGDRERIRMSAANLALYYLVRYLRGDILQL